MNNIDKTSCIIWPSNPIMTTMKRIYPNIKFITTIWKTTEALINTKQNNHNIKPRAEIYKITCKIVPRNI